MHTQRATFSSQADPGRLTVEVLGGFALVRDGEHLAPPRGRRTRLVQLLATFGGSLTVDAVVDHLWPGAAPDLARARLRNVLARLRDAAGDLVQRDVELLRLTPGTVVDATEFDRASRRALAASDAEAAVVSARDALRWYQGPLLPHLVYDAWTAAPRERLRRRYLDVLDLLAARSRATDPAQALRCLEEAIEHEPYGEQRYLEAAELRLAQGRRGAARALLLQARQVVDELGIPVPDRLLELVYAAERP